MTASTPRLGRIARMAASGVLVLLLTASRARAELQFADLPGLPDTIGLGGPFAGTHGGVLVVAGGANFSAAPLREGGPKVWHDDVYVLLPGAERWARQGRLPRPLAYGGSASTPHGIVMAGGSDAERVHADAWLARWDEAAGRLVLDELPPLPAPVAFGAAEAIGSRVYVLAGKRSKDDADLLQAMWVLDLEMPPGRRSWRGVTPCPGPARFKMVTAVQATGDGRPQLFACSGSRPRRGADGELRYEALTDAWRYDPAADAWTRVADLPQLDDPRDLPADARFADARWPVSAGTAMGLGPAHVLVFGGSTDRFIRDAAGRAVPPARRPPFAPRVLAYHTITDTWIDAGTMPVGVVTTRAVRWDGRIVIPSGEVRPGLRTPRVQSLTGVGRDGRFGALNGAVLVAYLLALIAMGVWFARREKTTGDFFLAGRRIPWWAAGLSIFGTQLSAITFLAIPAKTFATDWLYFIQNMGIVVVAPIVVALYLPFFRRLDVTTAYEYLERRFHLAVRLVGSFSFIAFQVARVGIVLFLPSLALAAVTGLPITGCIVVMGVLCTLYTVLGGIEAVVWTDVLQVAVLLAGALVALVIMVDGTDGGLAGLAEAARDADKLRLADVRGDWSGPAIGVILLGALFNNLVPYTSDQAVVQRYLTTGDERRAGRAVWTGALLAIPASILFFAVGTALFGFYGSNPDRLELAAPNDQVFAWFIAREMPAGLSGLVIAGVFAAAMSSVDSSMNSIATVVTHDLYRRLGGARGDRHYLAFARWVTIAVGALATGTALAMAGLEIRSLWDQFLAAVGLLGGTMAGLFALGILSRRAGTAGALIGAVAAIAALAYVRLLTELSGLLYGAVGMTVCVVVGWLASIVLPGRRETRPGLTLATLQRGETAP